jgi:hypothetical protein
MILGRLRASVPADFRKTEIRSIGYERTDRDRTCPHRPRAVTPRPSWNVARAVGVTPSDHRSAVTSHPSCDPRACRCSRDWRCLLRLSSPRQRAAQRRRAGFRARSIPRTGVCRQQVVAMAQPVVVPRWSADARVGPDPASPARVLAFSPMRFATRRSSSQLSVASPTRSGECQGSDAAGSRSTGSGRVQKNRIRSIAYTLTDRHWG